VKKVLAVMLAGIAVSACGGGGSTRSATPTTTAAKPGELVAQLASYDLATNRDQRVIIGLQSSGDDARLVSFGTARFSFAYLGTKETPNKPTTPGPVVEAHWIAVPGQQLPATLPVEARLADPSDGIGVYAAEPVRFDKAGYWRAVVTVNLDGRERSAEATMAVNTKPVVVAPGDPAPRTENLLPGAPDAPAKAVDSRAEDGGSVPDPELHTLTVAQALATGRPTMVVISTPVFCVSRFCGPITDSVAALARANAGRMNFVHIEVWRDFEKRQLNKAAAEWIYPPGAEDATEPWVFVIGRDGVVSRRFDNVASDTELADAVRAATG
jgi:hypothetical protein